MTIDPKRRSFLLTCACAATLAPLHRTFAAAPASDPYGQLEALEHRYGGRLGVSILDTGSGKRIGHRADERFPMCSTFKFLAAAQVLTRVDRGEEKLERRIVFAKKDLVAYSPMTEKHAGAPGMTLAELCHAAITLSDNTAGNLLLDSFGGPAGLTAFARTLGDTVTRLDRRETELNEAIPGDPRDTTTPAAMLDDMRRLLLGDALSPASRKQLADWLLANTTGAARLRAGLPGDWRVGDKTGTGANGASNDIAIVWPPDRAPLLVTAYYAESSIPQETRNAVLVEVGRIAAGSAMRA
ncbi:class A beta-lactamase [Pseudoxanthomonas yeongjuensis]|uniref:class A beta-lactamase n=1 Tax=Pseudoxanthomonas yeongjuensis TaxID=377616 RepID=UPI001FE5275C|nr:class A beta-lactamase [Pseudoxanthomonas yeongjuensis]